MWALLLALLLAGMAVSSTALVTTTCEGNSNVWHLSCSPSWCVFDTNVACQFSTPSINYVQEISGLTCKTCTQSSNAQCSTSALKSLLKSPSGQVKAAYCNDAYLVIHSNGQPNHQAYLDYIPTPPGAGGEGLNTQPPYTTCHTRTKIDQFQSYKVPLSYTILPSTSTNNASFPAGVQLLNVEELPGAGAMGVAVNGMPIFPAADNHNALFWEACEADYCNAHVGKGGDYHYHGDPYGTSCLYSDSDAVNNHPAQWGWGLDGPKIYGRYMRASEDGASISLDRCGGHSHGSYGYHYHSYAFEGTAANPTPASAVGKPYTAFMPAPASCWAADISAVPNFWSDHQVNYDNQRGQTYSLAGRSDLDQLRPCCGSKEYVVTSGITVNGAASNPAGTFGTNSAPPLASPSPLLLLCLLVGLFLYM